MLDYTLRFSKPEYRFEGDESWLCLKHDPYYIKGYYTVLPIKALDLDDNTLWQGDVTVSVILELWDKLVSKPYRDKLSYLLTKEFDLAEELQIRVKAATDIAIPFRPIEEAVLSIKGGFINVYVYYTTEAWSNYMFHDEPTVDPKLAYIFNESRMSFRFNLKRGHLYWTTGVDVKEPIEQTYFLMSGDDKQKCIRKALDRYWEDIQKVKPFTITLSQMDGNSWSSHYDTYEAMEKELRYISNLSTHSPLTDTYDINESRGWFMN
jgi:hypothetical protein